MTFIASSATYVDMEGFEALSITAANVETGWSLSILVPVDGTGTYTNFDMESDQGVITLNTDAASYSSIFPVNIDGQNSPGGFEMNVTQLTNTMISANLTANLGRSFMPNDWVHIDNASFNNLGLTGPIGGGGAEGSMTATIDGEDFTASEVDYTVIQLGNMSSHSITGIKADGEAISITFSTEPSPGTFELGGLNFAATVSYVQADGTSFTAQSGSLVLSNFSSGNSASGSFQLTAANPLDASDAVEITNGSFNVSN